MTAATSTAASAHPPSRIDQGNGSVTRSLYERLAGARGIAAIADDVVARHLSNPLIKTRFQITDQEKLSALKKVTCEFFGARSGGPEVYTGRNLVTAYKGMTSMSRSWSRRSATS
jgi:hypothetical protein